MPDDWSDDYTLTYDAWNRLVRIVDDTTQATVAEHAYDGQNRRVSEKIGETTRHFYHSDQWQVLEERVGAATDANRQYVWGIGGIDDLILRDRDVEAGGNLGKTGSGLDERLYALCDSYFNDVVALAGSDGTILERYRYSAYGTATILDDDFSADADNQSDYDWSYLYTTRHVDWATGLMYYRNRYYHTGLGRFISRDPVTYEAGDQNLYRYCGNMPLSFADPTGEHWYCLWIDDLLGIEHETTEQREDVRNGACSTLGGGSPTGFSEVAGAMSCAGEMFQSQNILNYFKNMRDKCVEGSPEWKKWNAKYQRTKTRLANAAAKKRLKKR